MQAEAPRTPAAAATAAGHGDVSLRNSTQSCSIRLGSDSEAESAVARGATSRGGTVSGRVGSNAVRLPSVGASGGLDDVITGGDDKAGDTDDEVWLQGEKSASPKRDSSVRSKRAQRDSRPKPTLPSSMLSEQAALGEDGAPQQTQQKSASTLPWLRPDDQQPSPAQPQQRQERDLEVPQKTPEDLSMDAISRALKSGVDKETLKQYIDEVAETVADNAGMLLIVLD